MDRVVFNCKRLSISFSARAHRRLGEWKLTTARVELFVCHRAILAHHGMVYQVDLQALLGVQRSTISVMLQRLEKLGYVERRRSDADRRKRVVVVTAAGYAAFAHAERLLEEGFYQSIVDTTLFIVDPGESLAVKRARLLRYVDVLRAQFGDTSRIPYPAMPWQPLCQPRAA